MSQPPRSPSRKEILRYVAGHRAAGAWIRAETLRRLETLSVDEARAQYDALCRVWEASQRAEDAPALDRLAAEARVALRRRLAGRR